MQQREKLLAIGFGAVIVLWLGGGIVANSVLGPFRERSERLTALNDEISRLTDQALQVARSKKQLAEWKAASLPPDRGAATSKRPDALDAQRLYQVWITDLTRLAGFDSAAIKPSAQRRVVRSGRGATAKNVYVAVGVSVEAEGRFSQLCAFLDHFYRAKLLHRVTQLTIDSRESEGDPLLRITLDAEGLALVDVPWRRTLFPETPLAQPLDDKADACTVAASKEFPAKPPFRVRIGNEYLTVTGVTDGEAGRQKWALTRGVDRTFAAHHPEGAVVELAPVHPDVPSRSVEDFREILAANVFIKPPPPKEYKLQFGPIGEQAFVRGESLAYTIPISGFDPTLGAPEFRLKSDPPPGLKLDHGSGKISWSPAADQAVGKFPLQVEVAHPSAEKGVAATTVTVVYREPNTPPTIELPLEQTAYIGQEWTLPLAVQDQETAVEKLSLKLENPPEGVTLDPVKREVKWTPSPATQPGDFTVAVTVTDDGMPPKSKTLAIPVKLEDDAAMFTYLVGAVSVNGEWQAWLYNRAQDQQTIIHIGDEVRVADIRGSVAEIGKDFIILKSGENQRRLELGQNLRQLPPPAPATARTDS